MARRIAGALALIVFAVCLWSGTAAGNPLEVVIGRAVVAMLATLVIGLVLGVMAQKMLEENLKLEEEKIRNDTVNSTPDGR